MKLHIAVLFVFVVAGCGRSEPESEAVVGPADVTSPTSESDSPATGTESASGSMPPAYVERDDVQRLLTQAGKLKSAGDFHGALAVVEQAVALDPASPSATSLKQVLEDLIRKMA